MFDKRKIVEKFGVSEHIVIYHGDCLELLKTIPDESLKLVVTSPPYNMGRLRGQVSTFNIHHDANICTIPFCQMLRSDPFFFPFSFN